MNVEVLRKTLHESEAGRVTFSQVVGELTHAGVESYFVDLIRGVDTFYMPNGDIHEEKLTPRLTDVAKDFSNSGIVAAIRAAQADEIRYPEFLKRSVAAGVIAYWVF